MEKNYPTNSNEVHNKLRTGLQNMAGNEQILPWEVDGWSVEVNAWILEVLSAQGVRVTGEVQEVQRRPWSVILRVPTKKNDFFCKICSPVLRHEPGLTMALSGWIPKHIIPVVAADESRGYMLLTDGGSTLRKQFELGMGISEWLKILPVYAGIQTALAGHRQELLDAGIIDRRLASLPEQFEVLLSDAAAMRIGKKDGLSPAEYDKLQEEIPVFKALCRQLGEYAIPETLEHDDFHDGNIFYNAETPVFFDWGETCLAHPFFSMVVGLNSIAYRFDLQPGDAQWIELRDAYLAPWEPEFEHRDLIEAFDIAMQVGAVNRALTWHRVVSSLPARWKRQNADAVPGWLQEYLERRSRHESI